MLASKMEWKSLSDMATFALGPSIWAIIFTALIALSLPSFLHLWIYRTKASTDLPAFLLTGRSGAGKTTIATFFERGKPVSTHTSQVPLAMETSLPVSQTAASNRYRSAHDPSSQVHKKLLLVDTPGHGKLRHFALDHIVKPQNLRGVIFVVDAATLSNDSPDAGKDGNGGLIGVAEYLHDVLLALQKRYTSTKSSKGPGRMPVLVAANKMDLFTALPAKLVKKSLEDEITKLRDTRAKGLVDSGISMDDGGAAYEERDILGGGGEGKFEFSLMEEYDIPVQVEGGSINGSGKAADVDGWWQWIADHL